MRMNWVDILLELPVDAVMREYLEVNGLEMPDDFGWSDTPQTSKAILEAVLAHDDLSVRDKLSAKLRASSALGDAGGKQSILEVAAFDSSVLTGLTSCLSDLHRSFWLYVKFPEIFDRALDIHYFDCHGGRAQQHDLGVSRRPNVSDAALARLRHEVAGFYQRELQCGDRSLAYVVERSPGVFLLSVHVKDLATLQLEFDGDDLKRRVGNPNIHSALEYSSSTGVTRSLVKGGAKYHQMLLAAFAEHLLDVKVEAQRLMPPTLDLSKLRLGFDVPQAINDGFSILQVKSLTFLSPDNRLKLDCTAMVASDRRCVTELIQDAIPDVINSHWTVAAAQINLYYPPEIGKSRSKVVSVEVTRKGRLNLHKFDAAMQARLEGYLVALGVLGVGQTLSPIEQQAQDVVNSESVYSE